MARPLRKPFGRSQANLKERRKERNKKRTGLGKADEPLSTSVIGPTSSPVRLKGIQANSRALALALQEEKLKNAGMFPSVPVTIPVVTGQEQRVGAPQGILEREEIPESETKATADDNKPACCFLEDCCESASANAVKETDPECGESFEPSRQCPQNVTSMACSRLSTGIAVVHPARERPPPLKCRQHDSRNHES